MQNGRDGDAMTAGEHLVQFFDGEDELVDAVAPYLAAGLDGGESVIVIAGAAHRSALERELAAMGTALGQAIAAGTYLAIDADEILRRLQYNPGGELDAAEFDEVVGGLVRRELASGRSLRAYGEIVGLMWERGDVNGAIALEALWNELQKQHRFTLFCGYPVIEDQLDEVKRVCCSHSFVLPSISDDRPPPYEVKPLGTEFWPDIEEPRRVRALLHSTLSELQFAEDLIERLTLAASELAANAVLHARTPFRLLIQPRRASVWIAVEDSSPLKDRLEVVGRTPHGLGLIAALALRWGVTPSPTGKLVWAEIPQ